MEDKFFANNLAVNIEKEIVENFISLRECEMQF
jgi:hypothetical protein